MAVIYSLVEKKPLGFTTALKASSGGAKNFIWGAIAQGLGDGSKSEDPV